MNAGAEYPRTYHVALAWRIAATISGVPLMAGSLVMAWRVWHSDSPEATLVWRMIAMLLSLGVFGGLGYYFAVGSNTDRIVLTEDGITVYQLLGGKRTQFWREQLRGRRLRFGVGQYNQGVPFTFLVPKDPALPPFKIDNGYATDAVYDAWIASLPDLDAQDVARNAGPV